MKSSPFPTSGYRNLRAFRYATNLSAEIYAYARRLPRNQRFALSFLLRRTTHEFIQGIIYAWQERYDPRAFHTRLTDAQSAAARLTLWLSLAHDSAYLADDEYVFLLEQTATLQAMLSRLSLHRITLLC